MTIIRGLPLVRAVQLPLTVGDRVSIQFLLSSKNGSKTLMRVCVRSCVRAYVRVCLCQRNGSRNMKYSLNRTNLKYQHSVNCHLYGFMG